MTPLFYNILMQVELTDSHISACNTAVEIVWDGTSVDPSADNVDKLNADQLLPW